MMPTSFLTFRTRWEMSETGALAPWPLVELTPLVGLAVIWTTKKKLVSDQRWALQLTERYKEDTRYLKSSGGLVCLSTRLTVAVPDDASPVCTLGAEKAEEVETPFWKD